MKKIRHYWRQGFHSRIARRFMIFTILCSSVLALLITSAQLYKDYLNDLSTLNKYVINIEKSRVPSLIESMWSIDDRLIETQLQGILQLDGVEYVAVINEDRTIAFGSEQDLLSKISYNYPLTRKEGKRDFILGELQVLISLDHVYSRLIKRGLTLLLTNSIKTFLVAMFILIIYQVMIGQHISHIATFAKCYKPENLKKHLSLERNFSGRDELTHLEKAINQWIDAQHTHVDELQQANEKISQQRDELHTTNTKLNHANDELAQFAYSASHDLKAPLTSILGFLRFAEQDIKQQDNERALSGIQRSLKEIDGLSARIEDMLALAKSESLENDWETVNIDSLVKNIWPSMQTAYDDTPSKISCSHEHQETLVTVKVRLQAVLENLLSNALKYANPDREIADIKIHTTSNQENFILSIRDNGIGIPEAYHAKVFKAFHRFANSARPSSGLGLAIVRKNVTQLGGDITFTSSSQGTTFTIVLPQNNSLSKLQANNA